MSTAEFRPYAECGVVKVDVSKPTSVLVGGLCWVATGSVRPYGKEKQHGTVHIRWSLPVGLRVKPVRAKVAFFGFEKVIERSVTVDKDGSIRSDEISPGFVSLGMCCYPNGLAVAIEVVGSADAVVEMPEDPASQFILEVDGREIPANLKILTESSNVFKDMLKLDFSPNKRRKIKLDGILADDFEAFMKCIVDRNLISGTNVDAVRGLADKYDVPKLMKRCSRYLCRAKDITLPRKFEIAEKWKDFYLVKLLTSAVATTDAAKSIRDSGTMEKLSEETQILIMRKMMSVL